MEKVRWGILSTADIGLRALVPAIRASQYGQVGAISNPLPNHLHGEWSTKAAQAGKPVLCEKPLACNAAEAQQMVDAFAGRNLLLAEGFMYRFHPQQQMVKKLIMEGAIGKLKFI